MSRIKNSVRCKRAHDLRTRRNDDRFFSRRRWTSIELEESSEVQQKGQALEKSNGGMICRSCSCGTCGLLRRGVCADIPCASPFAELAPKHMAPLSRPGRPRGTPKTRRRAISWQFIFSTSI